MTIESLQPNETPSDTDLIRSMAVSSAELWHEMLDRLTQIHESHIILARAVEELGTIVRQSMSGAPLPALEQVHRIASLPVGSMPSAVSLALGSGGATTASIAATSTITIPDGADAVAQAQAIVDALLGLEEQDSTSSTPTTTPAPVAETIEQRGDSKAAKAAAKSSAKAALKAPDTKGTGEDAGGGKTPIETTAVDATAVNVAGVTLEPAVQSQSPGPGPGPGPDVPATVVDHIAEPVLLVTLAEASTNSQDAAPGPAAIDPTYFGIPATLGELSTDAIDSLLAAEFGDPIVASETADLGTNGSVGAADAVVLDALLGTEFVSQAPAALTVVAPPPMSAPVAPVATAAAAVAPPPPATTASATPPSQMLPPPLIAPDIEFEEDTALEPVALHVHVAAPDPALVSPPVLTLAPVPPPQSELPTFSVVAQAPVAAPIVPPMAATPVAQVAPSAVAPIVQFRTVTPESPVAPHVMSAASMATEILAATPEEKKPEKPDEVEEEEINQNISEDLTILATNRKKRRFHRN